MAINQGVAPPDFTTAVGMVRLGLGDTDPTSVADSKGEYLWYSDDELTAIIASRGNSADRAVITIMRRIAGSTAMQLKKWSSADLSVDGPAISAALLASAKALEDELDDTASDGVVEFIAMVPVGGLDPLSTPLREGYLDYRPYEQPTNSWPV